ncbi:MAG: glycoside hydrolase [Gammaproteobacteria bacterium]|nr:glycoside hydrolase [Gammaproteobacteria bacterium]
MHQPWYRESQDGDYSLPWVYLHALKDYVDMAAHLEAHPRMRCVVNFTPVLLEQIDDYARQFEAYMDSAVRFSDPLLNLLAGVDPVPSGESARAEIVRACLRAHKRMMIDVHPRFRDLFGMVMSLDGKQVDLTRLRYMNEQFFLDLLSWYHIAWLGHSIKQMPPARALIERDAAFDAASRRSLLQIMRDAFDGLLERYAKLARNGQIELSMTPYGHPIVPLLIDLDAMHCALPEAKGPRATEYPGGLDRARWHVREGLRVFERFLGCKPAGVWLSEGGVSVDALKLLDEFGFAWSASGEGVWHNSRFLSGLEAHGQEARRSLFCAHRVNECKTRMFFRDDGLSDMIGFEYQQWNAADAAANFGQHLKNIANYLGDDCQEHVVSVILDGENAWEYYPDNAFHFLGALYEHLTANPHVRTITFSEALEHCPPQSMPSLCPGSWVYGSFSTWIGDEDKNRGWDLLVAAKQVYDEAITSKTFPERELALIERQLAICEGSDWFWWFGDYNPSDSVNDFDRLYRKQLRNLYRMLGEAPPDSLNVPLSSGGGAAENAGTMRRGHV